MLQGDRRLEIVAVAGDMTHRGLHADVLPLVYVPPGQRPQWSQHMVVKTARDPILFIKPVQEALRSFDPDQPIHDVQTMEQRIAQSLARDRFSAHLLGLFGILALTVAAVGLYGVLSSLTTQRAHEIAIRMALGAEARDVVKGIVGHAMKLVGAGALIGVAGAVAVVRVVRSLLFEVTATDPVAIAAATIVMVLVASLACWIPARAGSQIAPLMALRSE